MDEVEEPAATAAEAEARESTDRRLSAEPFAFGLGLSSLLSAATVVAAAPLLLVVVSLAIGEGLAGVGRPFWREWLVATLALTAAVAALLHLRAYGWREDKPLDYPVLPRLRVAAGAGLLAAAAAGIAGYRFVRPPGPDGDSLQLFHGAGVPSRILATAALLAAVGAVAVVVWSVRRSLRHEREWLAAGAPRRRAEWRPTRPPRRAMSGLLGAGLAVLLVPVGWPLAGLLQGQAADRSRSYVVSAAQFDPPRQDSTVLTTGTAGESWTRQDLHHAIPAGDLVIGLAEPTEGQPRNSTVLGLRADDGAQLWEWRIRTWVQDIVVDPVARRVLVLAAPTVVVLDFTGEVRSVETLAASSGVRGWRLVDQPLGTLRSDQPSHPPGLARIAVLQGHEGVGFYPTELLGVEVATGTVRWRADVPPQCEVAALVVPESSEQPVGSDALVGFGGGRFCRTNDHLTRFGPDGAQWSVSLSPDDSVLRGCDCVELWPGVLAPDLFSAVIIRRVADGSALPDSETELLLLDGAGQQQAAAPIDRNAGHAYLVGDGTVVAVPSREEWLRYDPAQERAGGLEPLPAPGLEGPSPPVAAWPLLIEHRDADTLVVWDAGNGLERLDDLTLPAGHGCSPAAGHLVAYRGHVTLTCADDRPRATVVALPAA